MNTIQIKDLPLVTSLAGNEDIMVSMPDGKSKRVKSEEFIVDNSSKYNSEVRTINNSDFFPPKTSQFQFLITPGSYGVIFTSKPIVDVDDVNFNLRVDFVSTGNTGSNSNQDILQTLTSSDGLSYTRKLYHVSGQQDMSATDLRLSSSTNEYFSYDTFTKYTKINETTLIEL